MLLPSRLRTCRSMHHPRELVLGHLVLASCFGLLLAPLQVSANDADQLAARFDRSASYGQRSAGRVDRLSVTPEFFGERDAYAWYRVETGEDRFEVVLIDVEAGQREVLFDQATLRLALAEHFPDALDSAALNIRNLQAAPEQATVQFRFRGKTWQWDREQQQVVAEAPDDAAAATPSGLPAMNTISPSRGGEATEIELQNQLDRPLNVFWVNTSGRRLAYGRVAAGENFPHPTFAGHVWLLTDDDGKEVAAFRAEEGRSLAIIDASTPAPKMRRDRREGFNRNQNNRQSPDGRWQVDFENHNVILLNLEQNSRLPLSSDGNANDGFAGRVWWSPDSQHFVVLKTKRAEQRQITLVQAAPANSLQPQLDVINYTKPGDPLDHPKPYLFSLERLPAADTPEAGPTTDVDVTKFAIDDSLFPNPFAINNFQWRADSSEFTFIYNQRGHQVLRLISIDPTSGQARAVIDETSETFVCYSHKFYLQRLEETNELIWMSERDGWNHLLLIDWATGEVKNQITAGGWVVRDVERVDVEKRQLWLTVSGRQMAEDPYHRHLLRVNFDGGDLAPLTDGDGDHRWEYSPTGRWLVDTYSRVDLPPVVELRDAETGQLVCTLERAGWSRLLQTGWQPPERFVAPGRDGSTTIHGVIVRPTNFDPKLKYPVLEAIYAGPQSAFTPKTFGLHNGLFEMAELGFIVVKLDGMGTSQRSKAFHDVCWKNLGDSGFPDRIRWITAAAAERPEMDLQRVGIWGGSAGGQSALRALLAHPDFYHAAAADCGCHDNRMDKIWWNEQWMGWPVGDHYAEQSNVTQAHRLQGKLLLTVGALDSNVDPSSTMQVAEALIKADKDFELIVFPNGGHGSGSSPYGKRRMKDFFIRTLGGPIEQTTHQVEGQES